MNRLFILTLILPILTLAFQAVGQFRQPAKVTPFTINIPQEKIQAITDRVKSARLPKAIPVTAGESSWQTGADIKWIEELRQYWVTQFDWRKAEAHMNSYPQYIADIDGYKIHFYYVKGEGKNPQPLVLTHGWPGSFIEFFDSIDPLTQPSKHGGKAEDAFTLIIPSMPGFGFSSMPAAPINGLTTARLWDKLVTEVIGHPRYFAQGGDFGAVITTSLGYLFPEHVKAIHLNMFIWGTPIPEKEQTPAEKKWLAQTAASWDAHFNYARIQMMEPLTAGIALNDSPLGTAAWIAQKFNAWSDNKGSLDSVINKGKIIADVMLYLLSEDGISGSFWYYRGFITEMGGKFHPGYVKAPTAIAKFPEEFINARPPIEAAKRVYNIYRFVDMPRGGHFAAMEQPALFVQEVRDAFRQFR